MKNKILVTGGCGFIASNFVRLLTYQGHSPIILDKMTYAADINRFKGIEYDIYIKRLHLGDICDEQSKIRNEIGWEPEIGIEEGLAKTVEWYRKNVWWWKPLKERLTRESKGFWS